MLEELDTINWQQITHAYGPADDVPKQIRALAYSNEEARKKAMHELNDNICHQGAVYEATAYAVPFLIELLHQERVQRREAILVLLVNIAQGYSYIDYLQNLELFQQIYQEEVQSNEWQVILDQELSWRQKAYEAVCKGVPIYLELIGHSDPALRAAAAYTVAMFQADDGTITQHLWEVLSKEEDTVTQASIILALGVPKNTKLPIQTHLTDLLHHTTDALIKTTAAMSLVRLAQQEAPHVAVVALVEAITYSESLNEKYRQLPWAREGVIVDVSMHLQLLGGSVAEFAVPALVQMLDSTSPYEAYIIAETVRYLVFQDTSVSEGIQFHEPNDLQQFALTAIKDSANVNAYIQSHVDSIPERAVPLMVRMLDSTNPYGALTVADPYKALIIVHTLIHMAFANTPMAEGTQFHELNDPQQRALTAINNINIETIWKINDDMALSQTMRTFNLPDEPDKLHTFVQDTPAT